MSVACRDWLSTLWPASFKGVPFYFESDKEEGGRGLIVHEFPNRDDPFVEDLGEAPRYYSGSAYVHGDEADQLASSLKAALASRGAGTLVVPYFGPVTVHCQTFERQTQRDQMGYVAFEIKCVRAGASSALISVPFLQNQAFVAVDRAASAVAALFPRTIATAGQPDFVVAAVTDTLQSAAAAVDVLRQTYPIDPAASGKLRDALSGLINEVPAAVTNAPAGDDASSIAAALISSVRTLGDALPASSAQKAALEYVEAFAIGADAPISPMTRIAASNAEAAARVARLAGLMAYAEAVLRSTYSSRPDGVTARAEVAERFENELFDTTGAANAALYVALDDLRGRVIAWLTAKINDLAPVITVESARIMPALALAWSLYADPVRSDELVARNGVRHPTFMPRLITALSR
ncbi:MAG: Phage tail/DNA circulation protein Mup43, N [Afipia sp.]|jgi:prophage DNA circulation protein|nr:MAG: Phage tail/DNA circulation protein Mup43, N [Afipia sp.]